MMKRTDTHPFRRTAIVAMIAMAATLAAFVLPSAAGATDQPDFVNGSGNARADIFRVGPAAGGLSLAPGVGVALAQHLGTVGYGQTNVFDLAGLDTSFDSDENLREFKRQFPNLRITSEQPGAAAGVRWEPKPGLIEDAAAQKAPVGESSFRIQGFSIPGILEVTGGQSRAFSGVYTLTEKGKTKLIRAAGGTVDIGRVTISLGTNGEVVLKNLRWQAAQITDQNDDQHPQAVGKFVIGQATYPDQNGKLTTQDFVTGTDAKALFDGIDQGLDASGTGLRLRAPELENNSGLVTLSPLGLEIVDSTLLSPFFGSPAGDQFQSQIREPLAQGFLQACDQATGGTGATGGNDGGGSTSTSTSTSSSGSPLILGRPDSAAMQTQAQADSGSDTTQPHEFDEFQNNGPEGQSQTPDYEPPGGNGSDQCGLPFLVFDVATGVFTGGGSLVLDIGGVRGITEGSVFDDFNFNQGGFDLGNTGTPTDNFVGTSSASPSPVVAGATPSAPPSFESPSTEPPATTIQPPTGGNQQAAAPQAYSLTGSRASAAWAVGLVGLAAALAMAATDYRRLRARRRAITPIS